MAFREYCHNNRPPPAKGYYVQVREYSGNGLAYRMVDQWVPNQMTTECQQPGAGHDPLPGCVGCAHLMEIMK